MAGSSDVVEGSVIDDVVTEIYLDQAGKVLEDRDEVLGVHVMGSCQGERLEGGTSLLQECDGVVDCPWLDDNVPHLRLDESVEEVVRAPPLTDDGVHVLQQTGGPGGQR